MFDKLEKIEAEYKEISGKLATAEVLADRQEYRKLAKRFSSLESLVKIIRKYKKFLTQKEETFSIIQSGGENSELVDLAKEDLEKINAEIKRLEEEIEGKIYEEESFPDRTAIVEIRPAAGGQESALFALDLLKMYSKYADSKKWEIEMLDSQPTEIGGIKECVFAVKGRGAYANFKFESGVHRVQRVPVTESGGRIHTSTVTVAVLMEPTNVEISIDPKDLKIDTFHSSGAGGQHVNTTDSAVRITHIPSGVVSTCQDERSQIKNRHKAMRILKARLLKYQQKQQIQGIDSERRKQIGKGGRSEKIRTYNFSQRRVTDHRGPITVYRLESVLEGNLDLIIKPLILQSRKERI